MAPTEPPPGADLADALRECASRASGTTSTCCWRWSQHPAFVAGELHTAFLDEHDVVEDLAEVPPTVSWPRPVRSTFWGRRRPIRGGRVGVAARPRRPAGDLEPAGRRTRPGVARPGR